MLRSTALLLLLVAGCVVQYAAAEVPTASQKMSPGATEVGKKAKKPPSCGDQTDKRDCLDIGAEEGDCAWCKGDFMPASCVGVKAAEFIPKSVAKCKLPRHREDDDEVEALDRKRKPAKKPTSCGDHKDKHDCLHRGAQEGDCAWCAGGYMPPSCVAIQAAHYIPEQVAKCKLPKKPRDDDNGEDRAVNEQQQQLEVARKHHSGGSSDGDWPSGGGDWPSGGGDWPSGGGDWPSGGGDSGGKSCRDLVKKKKCLRGTKDNTCAWCKNSYLGSKCVDESMIKYLPKFVADCKVGRDRKQTIGVS